MDDFSAATLHAGDASIFVRHAGSGPPLLLLHGFPQTHLMWRGVAPLLTRHFTVVCADLRGYGRSGCPPSTPDHAPYAKRAMATDMVVVMERLGFSRFAVAGHDRGGRVAYRLALDHPGRLERLAVLDIVPTWTMWHRMDARLATRAWHWMFLALPAPFPETMIGKDALYFFDTRAAAGTKIKSLSAFDPRALAHYHVFFNDPLRIHATCEDYRAGRTTDLAHDEETRASGQKITCPLLAIWGAAGGIPAETDAPLATWREWATDVRGFALDSGHYLAEEAPEATAEALLEFFA